MRQTITYTSIFISVVLVSLTFVTARSYVQLGVATALYPIVAYLAYKLFMDRKHSMYAGNAKPKVLQAKIVESKIHTAHADEETDADTTTATNRVTIADIDKRAFLKLIGATGISFFIFSLISRKTGLSLGPKSNDTTTLLDTTGKKIAPAEKQVTDGYKISEIDNEGIISYYGFTNIDGSWLIMKEDSDNGSFRYTKGSTDFPGSWIRRQKLTYDYFHNTF